MLIDIPGLMRKYNFQPKGVLHVGANVGEERHTYHTMRVHKVIWIEANPDIYGSLVHNLTPYPRQIAFNYCIGDKEGKEVIFHVSNNGSQSSSVLELGTHAQVHPEVHYVKDITMTMRRIDRLEESHDFSELDFLNVDLQGADLMAIKGMGSLLDQFRYIYMEINEKELYKGCALLPEVVTFLKSKGFLYKEHVIAGNAGWGDALFMRPNVS